VIIRSRFDRVKSQGREVCEKAPAGTKPGPALEVVTPASDAFELQADQ
jgi:hypothetical protein